MTGGAELTQTEKMAAVGSPALVFVGRAGFAVRQRPNTFCCVHYSADRLENIPEVLGKVRGFPFFCD